MFRLPKLRGRFAAGRRAHAPTNVGVIHGVWGEEIAAEVLRRKGYKIVARNVRPCAWDRRLEIDLIAYDREAEAITFVEVKQHAHHVEGETRLRSVNARKKRLLQQASSAWIRQQDWTGNYRFDVIEVYGEPGHGEVEVDHIRHVNLFVTPRQAVTWDYEEV